MNSRTSKAATVGDLVDYWKHAREHGPQSRDTAANYFGLIGRILRDQGVTEDRTLDSLDVARLVEQYANAHPGLAEVTTRGYRTGVIAAINGLTAARREPQDPPVKGYVLLTTSTPAEARRVVDLPDFISEQGTLTVRSRTAWATAIARVLSALPDLGELELHQVDLESVRSRFAQAAPTLAKSTIDQYANRFTNALRAYEKAPRPAAEKGKASRTRTAASPTPVVPGEGGAVQVFLPKGRSVSLRAPEDLTDAEARAAGAVLGLHHPAMFAASAPEADAEPHVWTLVFWPADAPDVPVCAHLEGTDFRAALAEFARSRTESRSGMDDGAAIDDMFHTEVLVALAFVGRHEAHDTGALLRGI